jgi:hypothetical protein
MLRRRRKSRFCPVLLKPSLLTRSGIEKGESRWLISALVWVTGIQLSELTRVFQSRCDGEAEEM